VGKNYRHKLGGSLTKTDIRNTMHCSWDDAEEIIEELNTFFFSSTMTSKHVSRMSQDYLRMMIDTNDMRVKMVHDCYLKLFHAICDDELGYEVVMMDEAQDSNEISMDLIMNKISNGNTIKVFVGDPYQQIYSFRKSINLMGQIEPTKQYPLSKSFRFGANIAHLASRLIDAEVAGNSTVSDKIYKAGEDLAQCTYIARTNVGVIENAIELSSNGHKVHFLKGFAEYSNDIKDTCYLEMGQKDNIKSGRIQKFRNFASYKTFCNNAKDSAGTLACRLVEQRGSYEVMQEINRLKENQTTKKHADYIVTNVHTAKGLEFDNVTLCDDFMDIHKIKAMGTLDTKTREELNLLYVACTRAKYVLVLNCSLSVWYGEPHIEQELDEVGLPV
jgi:F-box protein, helicase, 18